MLKPKTRWIVQQADEKLIEDLVTGLEITPLVASLLVNREMDTIEKAQSFLFENEQTFHDPYLLTSMENAVARIRTAIANQEPILIFGDYDADGVTSTVLMMTTLKELGANVQFYIPNRFTEGYGPNEQAFKYAAQMGIRLIVTVDTGIAAIHEANIAKELGIDLIITDHHEPGLELPEAVAIIHPKLENSTYPCQDLAGVGVAFKVATALYGYVPDHLLELAAIGTIADLVPLKGENRFIAKQGIRKLATTKRVGLQALAKVASIDLSTVNEETIGFAIAPRINAVGRLGSADPAVDLFLTTDVEEAEAIAAEIEQVNKERQAIVNTIVAEAIKEVEENNPLTENDCIVIGKQGWNSGVIGIVASKLVEKYYRPTVVLSFDEETGLAKGSARSIAGFDLFKNLSTCRELLLHYGGHKNAAGMTLQISDVNELRSRLNKLANEQLTEEDFYPLTKLDCEMEIKDIHLQAVEELQMLAPFGMSNPKPKVLIKDAAISQIRKIGADQTHLKVILEENGVTLDGVGFGLGHLFEHVSPRSKLAVIGELSINEWNNIRKPQIFLHDMAVHEWQLFDYRGLKQLDQLIETVGNGKWIVFNKRFQFTHEQVKDFICVETMEQAKSLNFHNEHVVLVDLPPSKEIVEALFSGKMPARIYTHFYQEENDFFSTMPTREHFKWFYAFLMKKAPFDLKRYGDELAKHRGWTRETIDFMSQVFLELDFIKENNGYITLNKGVNKKDLSVSSTYQQKQAHYALESELLYSSFQQLKSWFDQMIQGPVKIEEAVEEWI